MHKTLSLKRLVLLGVMVWLLVGAVAVFAQEATTAPAAEATVAAEATAPAEGTAPAAEVVAPAAESEGGIAALGLNAGYLLAQIINFLVIFGALGALLWRPILNMLDSRTAKIEKGLEDARVAAEARRNAEAEAEKILAA